MNLPYFREQFKYNHWANKATLKSMEAAKKLPEKTLVLLAHIGAAERIWRTRIQDLNSSHISVWPKQDLEECRKIATQNQQGWQNWLDDIDEDVLTSEITYHNSKGDIFESKVFDILTHVIIHGGYHRGQIASLLRQNKETPAITDYIFYKRQL